MTRVGATGILAGEAPANGRRRARDTLCDKNQCTDHLEKMANKTLFPIDSVVALRQPKTDRLILARFLGKQRGQNSFRPPENSSDPFFSGSCSEICARFPSTMWCGKSWVTCP